jgi:hypothetical protein
MLRDGVVADWEMQAAIDKDSSPISSSVQFISASSTRRGFDHYDSVDLDLRNGFGRVYWIS